MVAGGNPRRVLRAVREHYPVVLHGVSLSLGSADPLDERYLDELAPLAREVEPAWISDHLCWSSFGGHHAHDLLPLPYTEEALAHVVARVRARAGAARAADPGRERLELPRAITHSTMTEWEFLAALAERADCGLLLDVNNIFVSAHNHGFDAARLPRRRARRARRADPPRRPQRPRHAPARHARPPGVRRASGSSTATRVAALRRGVDADRVGRSASRRSSACSTSRGARRSSRARRWTERARAGERPALTLRRAAGALLRADHRARGRGATALGRRRASPREQSEPR